MKLSRSTFSSLNISLSIVALAAVVYIGYLASGNNAKSTAPAFHEVRLSAAVYPSFSNAFLNKDVGRMNGVVAQLAQDQALSNQIIAAGDHSSGLELNQHIEWLAELSSEIKATSELNSAQQSALLAKVANTSSSINWLKNVISNSHLKPGPAQAVLSPNYAVFNQLGPQVALIKVADDQQVAEQLLDNISSKLVAAVEAAAVQGVTATNFQADLTTLDEDASAGKALSAAAENELVSGGYILKNVSQNIGTGTLDIKAGLNAATTIVSGLVSS